MPQTYSLLPVKPGSAPWLYGMGRELFIDVTSYSSTEDWDRRRNARLQLWWHIGAFNTAGMVLVSLVFVGLVIFGQLGSPLATAAGSMGFTLVGIELVAAIMKRRIRAGTVACHPGHDLHANVTQLAASLGALYHLKAHSSVPEWAEGAALVEPDVTAGLVQDALRSRYPAIDADFVGELNAEVAAGLMNLTGIRMEQG